MRKPTGEEAQAVGASLAALSLQRCQFSRSTDIALHIKYVNQRKLHLEQWFLTGARPQGGVKKFSGGREPSRALQHEKFLNGNVYLPEVTPTRILRRYWFSSSRDGSRGYVYFQAEFEPASQGRN